MLTRPANKEVKNTPPPPTVLCQHSPNTEVKPPPPAFAYTCQHGENGDVELYCVVLCCVVWYALYDTCVTTSLHTIIGDGLKQTNFQSGGI